MITETWKSVVGYEGSYEVSNLGSVRSLPRAASSQKREAQMLGGKMLRPGRSAAGYPTVSLCRDGKAKTYTVHSLMAAVFIGPRPDTDDIDHINGIRSDNRLENLRYVPHTVNGRNRTIPRSASGVIGVYRSGKGWMAQLQKNGQSHHIGSYPTVELAAQARADAERAINFRGFGSG